MIPNERPTPLTDALRNKLEGAMSAETNDALDLASDLERSLAERTEERDKLLEKQSWLIGHPTAIEAAHQVVEWTKCEQDRDTALAKLAKCRDETYRAQTEALVLQAQLAGYLLSIAASDLRNETIFTTIDKLLAALGIPPARQTLEETK